MGLSQWLREEGREGGSAKKIRAMDGWMGGDINFLEG